MNQFQFESPSLMTRIAIGKAIGLVIGLVGALGVPAFLDQIDVMTRIGILLWYPTMGAFIGVFGVMVRHPVLDLPLPWWVRAPLIGGWMNFVLVFFAHEVMAGLLNGMTGIALSPFWFVLEGALVGALMGFVATRFGGEGPASVNADTASADAGEQAGIGTNG